MWNLPTIVKSLFRRSIERPRRCPIRRLQLQVEQLESRIALTAQLNFTGPLSDWTVAPVATGNASTDTINLQNALNNLSASHPVLYLPAGTYVINNTLNFDHQTGVSVLGAGPGQTTIQWVGAAGGTMVDEEGVSQSRFDRVTFDGNNGLAGTALVNWFIASAGPFASSGNEYDDDIFQNVGIGLQFGKMNGEASEITVQRDQFINCQKGVFVNDFNALDESIQDSFFSNCGYGVTNIGGAGNFNVDNSVFQNSTTADLGIRPTDPFSFRGNYSSGSNQFLVGGLVDSPSPVTIQHNIILDTTATPISLDGGGPLELIDNVIRNNSSYPGVDVSLQDGSSSADVLSVGNTFGVPSSVATTYQPFQVGRLMALDDTVVDRSTINPASPPQLWLNTPQMPSGEPIFTATSLDSMGIQNAINAAVTAVKAGTAVNPVVYLPAGRYDVSSTVVVPANVDIQLVGDGNYNSTILQWTGAAGGTVLDLQGPSRANLQNFYILAGSAANGILVENADQPGSRIYTDQIDAGNFDAPSRVGVLVNGLNNTSVELNNFLNWNDVTGIQVVGTGSPGASQVNVFNGNDESDTYAYAVQNGGQLLVEDTWNEQGNGNQFFNLTGAGNFTMQGSKISFATTSQDGQGEALDPNSPPLNINGFSGNVSLLGMSLDAGVVVQPATTANVLLGSSIDNAYNSFNPWPNGLYNFSTTSSAAQWQNESFNQIPDPSQLTDLANQQSGTVATNADNFLRQMLSQTRAAQPEPTPQTSLAAGLTDVGIYRVGVTGASTADFNISATSLPTPEPTGLSATGGKAQVALSWTASSGAVRYNIYRSTSSGGEGDTPYQTGVTATSFTDTGLVNGTTYYYQVTAVNGGGESAKSSEVSAMTAPSAPTGLTATDSYAQVALNWSASSGAASYNIYRSTSSGGETLYKSGVTTTSYTDTGLTNGTTYYYRVTAVNNTGESATSSEASATPTEASTPAAPADLSATAGNAQVALNWTASPGAASYNIYRSTSSGGETLYKSGVTTTSYTDISVSDGTHYYYEVTAVSSGDGESARSSEASATTAPATPTGLNATVGNTQVALNWNASSGAVSYNIYRSTSSGGEGNTPYRTGVTATSFPDTGLDNGTTYYYQITAVNNAGQSATSSEVLATPTEASTPLTTGVTNFGPLRNNFGGMVGAVITVGSSNLTVTALGRIMAAGDSQTHTVELVDASTGQVLSGGSVSLSMSGGTVGQFSYASLSSPVTLLAGHTYYLVSQETSGGDSWYDQPTYVTTTSVASVAGGVWSLNGSDVWTPVPLAGLEYVGVDLQYTPASIPAAPAGLSATAGNAQVALNWTASPGAASYNIYRSTSSGGETLYKSGVTSTSYTDTGVSDGTQYYYEVTAVSSGDGESARSSEASATTAPAAPTSLNATAGNTQVALNWTVSSGAVRYNVYRSTSSGGETLYKSGVTTTSYIDTGLTNGTTYYYQITAVNNVGESATSREASATTAPVTPAGLSATGGNVQVALRWTASSGAVRYNVYRSTSSSGETLYKSGVTTTSYTDTSVNNNTPYYYEVTAVSSGGAESATSREVSATTAPATPTGLNATVDNAQVALRWTASPGAVNYNVYRSSSSGGETLYKSGVTSTSYTDAGVNDGTPYYYEVTAVGSSGTESATSSEVSAATAPAAPTGLTATDSFAQVALSWNASSGAASYNIYRSTSSGGETLYKSGVTTTSYTDTGLTNGTTYYYQVTAVNNTGESATSSEASATPTEASTPAAPADLSATVGNAQVTLSWTASPGAVRYNIYRSTSSGGETLYKSGITTTSYTDTSVSDGTPYYYEVTAVGSGDTESASSSEVSATIAPATPTGLSATGGNAQVALSWTASSGTVSYNIYRSTNSGGEGSTPYRTGVTATSFTDTGLVNGVTYYYRVTAVNNTGESAKSSEASATPTGSASTPLTTGVTNFGPLRNDFGGMVGAVLAVGSSNLTVTALGRIMAAGDSQTHTVELVDASTGQVLSGGSVSLSMSGGTVGQFSYASLSSPVMLLAGHTYYLVSQETSGGDSWYDQPTYVTTTSVASVAGGVYSLNGSDVWTPVPLAGLEYVGVDLRYTTATTPPAAPAGLNATADNTQVALNWTASSGAVSYNIYRSTSSGGEGSTPYQTGVTATSFTDTGLTNGTTYYYQVTAVNNTGESAKSSEASVTPTGSASTPLTTGVTNFGPLRNDFGGMVGAVIAVGSSNLTVTALGRIMAPGDSQTHTVELIDASTGQVLSGGSVSLSMSGGTVGQFSYASLSSPVTLLAGHTYYLVSQETSGGDSWYDQPTNVTTTSVASVAGGVYSLNGSDVWTPVPVAGLEYVGVDLRYTGVPVAPAGLNATAGNTQVALSWTASSGAVSYNVYRSTSSGGETLYKSGVTTTSYTDMGLTNGTTYYYQVTAVNNAGESATSSEVSVTPTGSASMPLTTGVTNFGPLRNDFGGMVGAVLAVGSSNLTVTALGRIMAPGDSQTHTVELIDASTGQVLSGGSVSLSMSGGTVGQFTYASLSSPVTLLAGHTYYLVSQETSGGDSWYDQPTTVTTTSVASVTGGVWSLNGSDVWTPVPVAGLEYVGVDLQYTGAPELLAGTPLTGSHAPTLTQQQLDRVVAEAIPLWAAMGLSSAQLSALQHAQFILATLPRGLLGETVGNTIYIDRTADGYGWFLGSLLSPQVMRNQVDLLTVVCHELGNVLGLLELHGTHQQSGNVMDDTLAPGVRRLPAGSSGILADVSALDLYLKDRQTTIV